MGCCVSTPAAADQQAGGADSTKAAVYKPQAPQVPGVQSPAANGKGVGQQRQEEHQQQKCAVQAEAAAAAEQPQAPAAAEPDAGPSAPLMVLYKDVSSCPLADVPDPADEQQRFTQLCSYNILDTEPEEAYDRISALCKTLFNVPIAMVTFVDKDRVWIKSVQGLSGLKQVDRRKSLCAWTLLSRYPEALVVPDLTQDIRFKDSPIVTEWPRARFYAACPLVARTGSRLGTLCILDTKQRDFSADNTTLLTQLANMVMREVERKRAMNDALCSAAVRHQSGSSIIHDRQALMLVDMASPKWSIFLVNSAWQKVTGISQEMAVGSHFWDLFEPPLPAQVQAYQLAIEQHRNFELRVPVNASIPEGLSTNNPDALLHSSSGSFKQAGSSDGLMGLPSLPGSKGYQGPMHGVRSWGSKGEKEDGSSNGAPQQQQQQQQQADGAPEGPQQQQQGQQQAVELSAQQAAVLAATAAAAERSHPPLADAPARRRSIGGMRYIRFQFRSVSSVGSHMAPAVSVPPALVSVDRTNYYWGTVDVPVSSTTGDSSDWQGGYTFGAAQPTHAHPGHQQPHPQQHQQFLESGAPSMHGSACPSSSAYTVPSSDSSSALHVPMRTTFNLLPEDNPFQDITIGSLLGWGSFGRVHRGYWNGSLVAVKVLEQVAGDFNPCANLEPLLHHRLSHPHIVALFDVCTQEVDVCEDGRPLQEVWMVLEYCNRGTLSDAIQRGWLLTVHDGVPLTGHISMSKALTTAREVAGALEYLHAQNVLHGDLNGNNILLAGAHVSPGAPDQRGFTAKVADFGLSRLLAPDNEKIITKTHGTITHMAPEVITEAIHSRAADVYSFGVVLFELVTGVKPYVGMHYAQIVSSITSGKLLELLPQQATHLPAGLTELIAACLATSPNARPSFKQVHERLQALEQQVLQQARQPAQQPVQPVLQLSLPVQQPQKQQQPFRPQQQQQQQPQQQLFVQGGQNAAGPKSGTSAAAAAAAAAVAAASVDASAAGSSVAPDSQALLDVFAAAQQQSPPPGSIG